MKLDVKLFADGADKEGMLEMYSNPLSKSRTYCFRYQNIKKTDKDTYLSYFSSRSGHPHPSGLLYGDPLT